MAPAVYRRDAVTRVIAAGFLLLTAPWIHAAQNYPLGSIDLGKMLQNNGRPAADRSVTGDLLSIAGQKFERGVGTRTKSSIVIDLKGAAQRFTAFVGVDDGASDRKAAVEFQILSDGLLLWTSNLMKAGDPPKTVDLDLTGIRTVILQVNVAGDEAVETPVDWAEANFESTGGPPVAVSSGTPVASISNSSAASLPENAPATVVPLASLDLTKMSCGWHVPLANRSIGAHNLTIAGQRFDRGVGTHAPSAFTIELKGAARRFTAAVGVDDEKASAEGTVEFQVIGDGNLLWTSGIMRRTEPAKSADVDLAGVNQLTLKVTDGGDGNSSDHADWADAQLEMTNDQRPEAIQPVIP